MDVEVLTFDSLEIAYEKASLKSDREHVTPYIWRNTDQFNNRCVYAEKDYSKYRVTIDYQSDYEVAKKIAAEFYPDKPCYTQIIEFLDRNPSVRKINSDITRNEGYLLSIKEDKNEKNY